MYYVCVCIKTESLNALYMHGWICIYSERKRNKRIFLCILIHKQKSMCKIGYSKHQKQLSSAIYDLFTLTPRFKIKFFTLQFTVIIRYTSLPKSHICIERVPVFVF